MTGQHQELRCIFLLSLWKEPGRLGNGRAEPPGHPALWGTGEPPGLGLLDAGAHPGSVAEVPENAPSPKSPDNLRAPAAPCAAPAVSLAPGLPKLVRPLLHRSGSGLLLPGTGMWEERGCQAWQLAQKLESWADTRRPQPSMTHQHLPSREPRTTAGSIFTTWGVSELPARRAAASQSRLLSFQRQEGPGEMGGAPLAHPSGPRPRLSEVEGPRLATQGSVPTQDACSGLRARGTFWKVNLKFSNGNSVKQQWVLRLWAPGAPSSETDQSPPAPQTPWGAACARLAPLTSWASLARV